MKLNEFQDQLKEILKDRKPHPQDEIIAEMVKANPAALKESMNKLEDTLAPLVISCSLLGISLEDIARNILELAKEAVAREEIMKSAGSVKKDPTLH